ncbi:MAG: peptidase domain-containing ABC transporter [Chitinophagaceae bacterium]|nr:peptidase domain-containing ABC transporter [Chitinophagaceae bacterium]
MKKSFLAYRQYDSMDCGPTCLAMICKYYQKNIPIQLLRDKTQIGKEGVNLLGISEAAESIGFRTKSVRLTYKELFADALLPAILHCDQHHFVVAVPQKSKGKKFTVADPAKGIITYTREEFLQHWVSNKTNGQEEGIALLLEPTPAFYKYEDDSPLSIGEARPDDLVGRGSGVRPLGFTSIFSYITPYKKLVFQLFLGLGVASILQLILPFLTQSVVDVGVNTANIHFVYIVILAQLALFAGRMVVEFVRSWILLHISTRINVSILTDFLIKLMKLPVSFFDSKKTGDVLQRMNDHQRIESFLTGSSLNVLFSLVNLLIFSVVLAVFNVYIFAVFGIASVLYAGWVMLFLKKRKELDYKRFEIASQEQSATIQLIQGMQEIKLNGAEQPMRWNWERLQAKLFKFSMKGLALNQWQQSGAFFINEGKNIIITFLSAKAVIDGQMTLGSMLAVQYIIGQLNSPVEQMIGFVQSWQNAKISMDRLNEIHTIEDEEPAHKQLLKELPFAFRRQIVGGSSPSQTQSPSKSLQRGDFSSAQGQLIQEHDNYSSLKFSEHQIYNEFINSEGCELGFSLSGGVRGACIGLHNISFTYPGAGNEPVLKNINLQIPKGKTTAIVGMSGSGKTTLLKLLLKFYEPQKGDIKLISSSAINGNGTLLSSISHKTWRNYCGVVMQESFIFSDTIAKNIAVGVDKIDMERLHHSVSVANILEFIESLPLGFNTKIGAEGMGVSMGQKQRILIARAVYRNPEFIFLDEATNSLDANNENVIINNLESFLKGRTVIVVAHRLSTVKHADQIVVLNKGVISERGTHQELVNLKGEYFTLVKNQLELGE